MTSAPAVTGGASCLILPNYLELLTAFLKLLNQFIKSISEKPQSPNYPQKLLSLSANAHPATQPPFMREKNVSR